MTRSHLFFAILLGVLPAVAWLLFWLKEDSKKPEPKSLILKTFILGMLSVFLVIPFQRVSEGWFTGLVFASYLSWALLEEVFKLGAAYFGGIGSKENNEPLDAVIYLITAALGFAALENVLFIINPLRNLDLALGVTTGSMRFIGSSLLHIVSSGALAVTVSLSYYKPKYLKRIWLLSGIVLATAIHTIFNLLIISRYTLGAQFAFIGVWSLIPLLFLIIERIKTLRSKKENI